ncbi:MAG: hypothetical protein KAH12_09225, partial [Anaerolineales bacterium]|nr:hypothetical protein [Anaerolineales bacterium]
MKNLRNLFQLSIKLVFFFTVCLASFTYFPSETDSTALAASYSSADYHAVPPFISRGVKPNVLIIIDNSNSMDEDIDGNAVGSAAPNSRSEIARQAIITLIDANSDRMRFGLMAYKQNSISRRHIHNATYYCSHDPDTYDAEGIPTPKDPSTNTLMFPNPSAPGRFIYYDQALPFYAFSDLGNCFCYCQDYSEDGDISNDIYAWYRTKTGITDPPSGEDPAGYGYTNNWGNDYFTLTDDDIAAGFDQIGEQMSWVHIGLTWFSNSSPGDGELHEPIEDSTTTDHITDLHNKLGTSQFASYVDTPLRNAGLTPIEGTLKSCRDYYKGTYPGHPSPVTNWCQKNFVILVTDGLPSVNTSGHADDADALLPGVESAVVSLRTTSVPLPSGTTVFDIQTFVLGFALPPGLGSKLDDIAVAGGTDEDGHAFIAGSSDELATALQKIFLEILNRASSGSAASVISNSRSGEGAIYQSIFFPELYDASSHSVTWTGDVHALLVDKFGRMHED